MKSLLAVGLSVLSFAQFSFAAEKLVLKQSNSTDLNEIVADPIGFPIRSLEEGHYVSTDGAFTNLEISRWADEYTGTALIAYGPAYLQARYNITRSRDNQFTGTGTITAIYANGQSCVYPTTLTIKAYDTGLYIKSAVPSAIPSQVNGRVCVKYENVTITHRKPYVLEE